MSKEYKEHIEREDAKERLRIWLSDCVLDRDNEAAGILSRRSMHSLKQSAAEVTHWMPLPEPLKEEGK